ncbi:MAG TPA: dTDP-glucose 4,6-dehydratase [Actinomycetes bacterium]|nr:dTDP-glucose 4,6-dehydratase [Actinomycetes bacterium]
MRIFVTGGAGFIGSHYVRTMLGGGYPGWEDAEVTVYDALTYAGNRANLASVADHPRFRFVRGDVCDVAALDATIPGHQVVVNFAAETHVDRSIDGPAAFVLTNVVGTQTLLDACLRHGVERVVHVGTDEVYGSIDVGAWTEEAPLLPNSPYAASKAGAELMVRAYHRTYGLNVSSTRCSNNYGPYQFPEKLIPLFVTRLLEHRTVPLYGDGGNVRDWLHVDDHCQGVQLVVEHGVAGAAYNIGGGEELSNKALTQRILDAMGAGWDQVEYVADRPGHDRRYALDDARVRALGYRPRHTFADGLAETIEWYRTNQAWWRPLLVGAP